MFNVTVQTMKSEVEDDTVIGKKTVIPR